MTKPLTPVVLDLETYFAEDYTLSRMSTEAYCRDPRFEAHGAAIKWSQSVPARWYPEKELRYVLKEHDWSDTFLIHHHANFDGFILSHHYNVVPRLYGCTLNMARLLLGNHIGVSLDSVREQFGIPLKKTPYNLFRGKHWHELDAATQELVGDGACDEVESIWRIFGELAKQFPPVQLEVVDILVRMFVTPVLLGDSAFFGKVWEAEAAKKQNLLQDLNITEADLQSADRFADLLREQGVELEYKDGKNKPIPCFAKTDQFMKDLVDSDDDIVSSLAQARLGVKSTIQQTRAATLGWTASRGALPVYIRAYGARTTRPSGGDSSNYLNMKKADPDMPVDDTNINLKGGICAPPGYLLAAIDASQIECIAEDQRVLTERGPKAIQDVQLGERIWDGQAFVEHSGVICKGIREVISYQGLTATPEHVIYPRSDPFKKGIKMRDAAALGLDIQAHSCANAVCETSLRSAILSWLQNIWSARDKVFISQCESFSFVGAGESSPSYLRRSGDRPNQQRRSLRAWKLTALDAARECQQSLYNFLGSYLWRQAGNAGFQTRPSRMWLWPRSNKDSSRERTYRRADYRTMENLAWKNDVAKADAKAGEVQNSRSIQKERLAQKARVYDIINAGPRYRFMVEGVIVSNCRLLNEVAGQHDVVDKFRNGDDVYSTVASAFYGYPVNKKDHPNERQLGKVVELQAGYQSGGEKIRATLRNKAKILISEADGIKARDAYRNTHPAVVDLWKQGGRMLSRLAGGPPCQWGPVEVRDGRMWLPNGCPLIYDTLEYHREPEGGDEYWRVRTRRGWEKIYGGKLVENCLSADTKVLTDSGWKPIVNVTATDHVHDGIRFVSHSGLRRTGFRRTIKVDGVWMTEDHKVLCDNGWVRASQAQRLHRPEIRVSDCNSRRRNRWAKTFLAAALRSVWQRIQRSFQQLYTQSVDAPLSDRGGMAGGTMVHRAEFYEPTYDLLNCGPLERFVVLGDGGPFIVHNCIQALAWNLVSDAMVRINRLGYRTLNCPYDELLILIPRDGQEHQHLQKCKDEMVRPVPWLPNLPLGVEGELKERYG